jgi:uncharacterized protein YdhG (YjbR/CyaY superfamily)
MKPKKAKTIDDYLAALSDDKRAALERLRKTIRAAAPRAEECISYQLPAFRLDGKLLVAFGAAVNHCAFYPGSIVEAYKDELKNYDTSKGTIRFQADNPTGWPRSEVGECSDRKEQERPATASSGGH